MPLLSGLADFLHDLKQLERAAAPHHGTLILDLFRRHTPFSSGAVYLREGTGSSMRLSANSARYDAPDSLDIKMPAGVTIHHELPIVPSPHAIVPIRGHRDSHGLVALSREGPHPATEEDIELLRAAEAFLGSVMQNHRLLQDMREGDFQLKYRLWELESLYDIGLSIAATLNLEDLAEEILLRTVSLINARRAALFLLEGGRFKLYRAYGEVRSEFLDQELDGTLSSRLLDDGVPITFDSSIDCIFPNCGSFVALPIRGNNEIIGVIAAADREHRDGVGPFEENDLRLLSLFGSQVAIALENARLHRTALEKQVIERELELAATIQRDILPKTLPDIPRFDVAAISKPARQVGGDYHAFFPRDGVLSLIVADVAGKSMPAALLVSALHAAVQLLFEEGRDLGEIATELNKHIHRWSAENKFITMVVATIDPEEETIRYVNCGHNPVYVVVDRRLDMLRSNGLPIGIMGGTRYATQTRSFPAGSLFVLYSDGITEAENVAGEEFDNPRLEAVIREHIDSSVRTLADSIAASVDAFVGEAPQKDDQTLVVVRLQK